MIKRIAITTGDTDGIGLEVSTKALEFIGPQKNVQFLLFRSPSITKIETTRLSPFYKESKRKSFVSLEQVSIQKNLANSPLIEIASTTSPAVWVETAAQACVSGKLHALVTGPLSKKLILESRMSDIGHTDILKRITNRPEAYMAFAGRHFSVVLATAHIPLAEVPKKLTQDRVFNACILADKFKQNLSPARRKLPLAVLGLNPHSGEQCLLGREEFDVLSPVIQKLNSLGISTKGPLVPDAAFSRENWKQFSCFIACYHDQGLIPFKAFHGYNSGTHVTLGLPLLRTSVDHGTAKNIFGQNLAEPGSMIDSIKWAMRAKSTDLN